MAKTNTTGTEIYPLEKARVQDCDFSFLCEKQWQELNKTTQDNIRHCEECKRDVYLCTTIKERDAARDAGRCIAIPITSLYPHAGRLMTMGVPSPVPAIARATEGASALDLDYLDVPSFLRRQAD